MTTIKVNKLVSIFTVCACMLLVAPVNAYAEYYLVYAPPGAPVCNYCTKHHVKKISHKKHHKCHYAKHHRKHRRSSYSIAVYYYPTCVYPPGCPCNVAWVPVSCGSCGNAYKYYDNFATQPETYYSNGDDEYSSDDLDRATVDDDPNIYPEMDIDN